MRQQHWKQSIFRFMSAQTLSLLGSSIVQYAIIWEITLSTSSGVMLTLATLCGFLPQILISLFAGVWVDRYDRKKLIMFADSSIALATLVLAICSFSGYRGTALLLVALAVRAVGTGIQTPAVHAMIPQIVPPENLLKVGGIQSVLSSTMMFLAPAASGALLSVAPLPYALLVDVVTAILGVGITSTVRVHRAAPKKEKATDFLTEIKEGFAYLRKEKQLRNLLLYQLLLLFLISPSAFLTPLLVTRTFGPEVWRLTAGEMSYALGMVAGGFLIATWGGFKNKLNTTMLAGTLYGLLMLAIAGAPSFVVYLICNTCIGLAAPCYNAPITATLQQSVPSAMQGRVFGFLQIVTSCALPMGMMLFGPLADFVTVQTLLLIGGSLVLLLSIYVCTTRALHAR